MVGLDRGRMQRKTTLEETTQSGRECRYLYPIGLGAMMMIKVPKSEYELFMCTQDGVRAKASYQLWAP